MANQDIVKLFYTAFQKKDFMTMQSLYADNATFSDPVFQNLSASEVKGMWEMLLTSSTDLKLDFSNIQANGEEASCDWQAWYTFTLTGKKVHNMIHAEFVIRDGKIISHRDHFDLYRWSRMAFGISGIVLGWTGFMQGKVRSRARHRLDSFMQKKKASAIPG
jgi:ketosteroid isomerase-like protein